VVEIPAVFLPAEESLDMFDSESGYRFQNGPSKFMFDSESDSSGDLGHSDSDAELVEVS
jgi:hypothetical protein